MSLEDILLGLDASDGPPSGSREKYKRAPFSYPGGKYRFLDRILPLLPYRSVWVEAFGGSGVVTLNRTPSKLEVYNDRYSGVVAFYRCLRDPVLSASLLERLKLVLYSREEFLLSLDWESPSDPVERAFRWYVSVQQSFSAYGKAWGRGTIVSEAHSWWSGLSGIKETIERFRLVQVENLDWETCLRDYDGPDTVFYLDPPYFATHAHAYNLSFTRSDHVRLVEVIHSLKGFVALSGYATELYESYPWSNRISFPGTIRVNGRKGGSDREHPDTIEVVWIKEASD